MICMESNKERSNGIRDVLKSSIESRVTIVLERGQRLTVEVDAVVDDLLVASVGNRILFINIECICVVITCCEEVLEFLLNKDGVNRREEEYWYIKGTRIIPRPLLFLLQHLFLFLSQSICFVQLYWI